MHYVANLTIPKTNDRKITKVRYTEIDIWGSLIQGKYEIDRGIWE